VPQEDSKRFRRRLGAYFKQYLGVLVTGTGRDLKRELGVEVPWSKGYDIPRFFVDAELQDVLDAITIIRGRIKSSVIISVSPREEWGQFVQRVFKEENLGYRLDEKCGVHPFIDEEFERSRISVLSCLGESKYAAVLAAFEESHNKLEPDPPDTKGAIRAVFEAVEILFKLMTDAKDKSRLNSSGVKDKLKPIAKSVYGADHTASKAVEHLLDGMCDWIDACHMYRHGQKVKEPNNPPMGLAVRLISEGAAHLRWLVELENLQVVDPH
jgi:hypothetical protein